MIEVLTRILTKSNIFILKYNIFLVALIPNSYIFNSAQLKPKRKEKMNKEKLIMMLLNEDQGSSNETPFIVGKSYLIRTVTHIDVILKHASWIADTGRYHDCLTEGNFSEVEPYPNEVMVSIGCICDATEWTHALPRDQK